MGHVGYNALKLMSDKEMVQGLPKMISPTGMCEGYLVGKQTQNLTHIILTS